VQQVVEERFDWEVHIAVDESEAMAEMRSFDPDLLLCDINLHGRLDGIDLVASFQESFNFQTIFITSYQNQEVFDKAAKVRASSFLIKPFAKPQLLATLTMLEGQMQRPPEAKGVDAKEILTRAEYEVLQLIARNRSSREIAEALHISPLTVKNHRHNIGRKLDLEPGNNAILKWAVEHRHRI